MSEMALNHFYKEVTLLTRQDLVKQKMLLPPETQLELCAAHTRQHRNTAEALLVQDCERSQKNNPKKIISVLQKAFPREGVEITDFKPLEIAQGIENIASVIAVNTEKHFYNGTASILTGITHLVKLPVVRWDFIIDEYQIYQSKLWGADAVRMVVALLDQAELINFCSSAQAQDLEVIFEIHTLREYERLQDLLGENSIIYLDNEDLTIEQVQDILGRIPHDTPALLNGCHWNKSDLKEFCADGLVLDNSQHHSPSLLKKFIQEL